MWLKWLPWKLAISRLAKAHGFLDPLPLLAHLRAFAQPSEVAEPIELLRAGVVMHARGLINSRVLQHNLDWVWPFWVESQFNPASDAFIPRAFSLTHINLTNRNWTAAGYPDIDALPLVDPRGLLTPHYDGWSLDAWIVPAEGSPLFPSRALDCECRQELDFADGLAVTTRISRDGLALENSVHVDEEGQCVQQLCANSAAPANLVVTLRPCNPEGIAFIHSVSLDATRTGWCTDGNLRVHFSEPPHTHHVSDYRRGDVAIHLKDLTDEQKGTCDVGMVTAAALFTIPPGQPLRLKVTVPLVAKKPAKAATGGWHEALQGATRLRVPEARLQFLWDAALRTLVLCSPDDAVPGTYTYKRFWFRDAAFMIYALLQAGLPERAERAVANFFPRQNRSGYFHSQDGEWDSNGEALWTMAQLCHFKGCPPPGQWTDAIRKGAQWITDKRVRNAAGSAHQGLLPAGFSAEHLGANDYYYWDDFWGVAGLDAAAWMMDQLHLRDDAAGMEAQAAGFREAIQRSLNLAYGRLGQRTMPAAPSRRMDAGAIGSIVAGYPLQLEAPDSPELLATVAFLLENCAFHGAFFQDMVHSGVNPYLTLHLAQVLMRAGDARHASLRDAVAALASPTGQWPEAVHPRTGGGCMGDGQHGWAAAEWISIMRHSFVREEGNTLVLGSGMDAGWLRQPEPFGIRNAPTHFGRVDLWFTPAANGWSVQWKGNWHRPPEAITLAIPGRARQALEQAEGVLELAPAGPRP